MILPQSQGEIAVSFAIGHRQAEKFFTVHDIDDDSILHTDFNFIPMLGFQKVAVSVYSFP